MDSEELISPRLQELGDALRAGEIEGFMKWFRLTSISDYYMRRWFRGYAVKKAPPAECRVKIENLTPLSGSLQQGVIVIDLFYEAYESERAHFKVDLQKDERSPAFFITSCTIHMNAKDWLDEPATPVPFVIPRSQDRRETIDTGWWEKSELSEIAYSSRDHLKESLYARAVPKSIRFRRSHPEIDSAAYLSDLMTLRLCQLAFSLKSDDITAMAKGLHAFGQKALIPKTYDNFGGENQPDFPARELSLLPLFNVDEIFAGEKAGQPVIASCVEISSFYASMLRLGGIDPLQVFIVIQPFHYFTLFKLPRGYYIMSFNEVLPMSPNRLYGDTDVTRIVSPVYFLDEAGQTNMPDQVLSATRDFFQEGVPVFSIPTAADKADTLPFEAEFPLRALDFNSPLELHTTLRKQVFTMSRKYPASPFTWAKYSYQTLLVNQPQAYVTWSLNAPASKNFAQETGSLETLFTWMQTHLKAGSIFQEPDRIMTADQVLRHRQGTPKDRALFVFAIAKLMKVIQSGGISLTSAGSYVVCDEGIQPRSIYDAQTLQKVSRITGRLILAFDNLHVYNPLKNHHQDPPPWLSLVN